MNMLTRLDEIPAMTQIDSSRYLGNKTLRTDAHTHGRADNMKTVYPPQTKFAGGIRGIKIKVFYRTFTIYRSVPV